MQKNAGFTLIELLVVVLIIGILSAVALPQYTVAVEKSRTTELVNNVRNIIVADQMWQLANGNEIYSSWEDLYDIPGSTCSSAYACTTKHFSYDLDVMSYGTMFQIANGDRIPNREYEWEVQRLPDGTYVRICYANTNSVGRAVCRGLEAQGWKYEDGTQ